MKISTLLAFSVLLLASFFPLACSPPRKTKTNKSEPITFPGLERVEKPDAAQVELVQEHRHGVDSGSQNCAPSECKKAPSSLCKDSKTQQLFVSPGSCHPTEDRCVYQIKEVRCKERCEQGACVSSAESCLGKVCLTPPTSSCVDSKTLRSFEKPGLCNLGKCSYRETRTACSFGCKSGKCLEDPCKNKACKTPPKSQCKDSSTLLYYQPTGSCQGGRCNYTSFLQKCPYGCKSGACVPGVGFSALTPARFLDTRGSSRPAAGAKRCVAVAGKGGVPSNARAVYLNLTAVNPSESGFVTAYPKGKPVPNTSNLNYSKGETISNGSIVPLGAGGELCLFTQAATDLVMDVSGYFGIRSDYFPLVNARALDTRKSAPIESQNERCVKVTGVFGIPTKAKALFVNVTSVNPSSLGFFTIYPKGTSRPNTSNLNFVAGQTIANGGVVKPGSGGEICIYSFGKTDALLDILGYFGDLSNVQPRTPSRLLDTRSSAKLTAQKTFCFGVKGSKGLPSNAAAGALNITLVAPSGAGYATAFAEGQPRPNTSSINVVTGRAQSNNLLVPLGASGRICVYSSVSAHLIVDAVASFAALSSNPPCTGIRCTTPPPAVCDGGNKILSYGAKGNCQSGLCVYPVQTTACPWGCANAKCKPKPPAPAFTFHRVSSWQTRSQPVQSSASMNLKALRYITIHYPGGTIDVDGKDNVYQDADFAQILRNMQNDYVRNRGYSLGYNSAIAPDGDEWEIRGSRYRCAANGCTRVNTPGYAIIVVTPSINASPSSAQVRGVNQAIARVRAMAKAAGNTNTLVVNGHRDVKPLCGKGGTACPGTPLYNLIKNGAIK